MVGSASLARIRGSVGEWSPVTWLGIGWGSLGLGNAMDDGAYSTRSLVLMSLGVGAIVVGAVRWARRRSRAGTASIGVWVALGIAFFVALRYPAGLYGSGEALTASRLLAAVTVVIAVTLALLTSRRRNGGTRLFALILALSVASWVLMIKASPRPAIDVWYMYQTAADSLLHGQNFYATHWTSGIHGEVSNQFVYLPGSVVVLAPFKWLLGDVRYGLVAALALAAVGVFRMTSGPRAWLLASLVLVVPKLTFGVEQSWNDPLLLVFVVGAVLAVRKGHTGLATVSFGMALACKQYAWLFVPAAAAWPEFGWRRSIFAAGGAGCLAIPWFLASPRAFWQGAFLYNLRLPPRPDSLSLYSLALRHNETPGYGLLVVCTLAAIALSLWLARRGSSGFVLGLAVVMAGFDLSSKQTFFNEWYLVIGFVAVAIALVDSASSPEDGRLCTPAEPVLISAPPSRR